MTRALLGQLYTQLSGAATFHMLQQVARGEVRKPRRQPCGSSRPQMNCARIVLHKLTEQGQQGVEVEAETDLQGASTRACVRVSGTV